MAIIKVVDGQGNKLTISGTACKLREQKDIKGAEMVRKVT